MTEAIRSVAKRCAGTRRDGRPCEAPVSGTSGYCYSHDESRAEERTATRERGGRNSAKLIRLRGLVPPRLVPIFDVLESALAEVHSGEL
jgi:hypothetical protein